MKYVTSIFVSVLILLSGNTYCQTQTKSDSIRIAYFDKMDKNRLVVVGVFYLPTSIGYMLATPRIRDEDNLELMDFFTMLGLGTLTHTIAWAIIRPIARKKLSRKLGIDPELAKAWEKQRYKGLNYSILQSEPNDSLSNRN